MPLNRGPVGRERGLEGTWRISAKTQEVKKFGKRANSRTTVSRRSLCTNPCENPGNRPVRPNFARYGLLFAIRLVSHQKVILISIFVGDQFSQPSWFSESAPEPIHHLYARAWNGSEMRDDRFPATSGDSGSQSVCQITIYTRSQSRIVKNEAR